MAAWLSSTFGLAKTTGLGASVVDTFTFSTPVSALEIVHHGNVANPLYFVLDDAVAAPTVAGDGFEPVLPGERIRVSKLGNGAANNVVSIISAGAATVSVIGIR